MMCHDAQDGDLQSADDSNSIPVDEEGNHVETRRSRPNSSEGHLALRSLTNDSFAREGL